MTLDPQTTEMVLGRERPQWVTRRLKVRWGHFSSPPPMAWLLSLAHVPVPCACGASSSWERRSHLRLHAEAVEGFSTALSSHVLAVETE